MPRFKLCSLPAMSLSYFLQYSHFMASSVPSCITDNNSKIDDNLIISFFGIQSDADRQQNLGVLELIAATDHTFSEFCKSFSPSVIDGKFQTFGGRVSWRQPIFQIGDFVLVLLNTGVKYGPNPIFLIRTNHPII